VLPDAMCVFKPKIPILVNFGRPCNGRCWYFLRPFCPFYGRMVFFWPFGTFCSHLVYFFQFWYVVLRKIWQALVPQCRKPRIRHLSKWQAGLPSRVTSLGEF
jgi:hypothetical protein